MGLKDTADVDTSSLAAKVILLLSSLKFTNYILIN